MRRAIALHPLETRLPPPLLVVMLGVASWLLARYVPAGGGVRGVLRTRAVLVVSS